MARPTCHHFEELTSLMDATSDVCDQCVAIGDTWLHLRSCLLCGNVGCCDNSKNRHARRHWEDHDHPLIKSIEAQESWRYCFADQVILR
jgi:uncharacterized UBP type Zn finger protein